MGDGAASGALDWPGMSDPPDQDPAAETEALWTQAKGCFRRRDYPTAAALLARLVAAQGGAPGLDMAAARLLYGVTLLRLARPAEGVPQLKLAVELDPENPRAHQKLGSGLARLGLDEEALPHLERAAAMAPGDAEYQWRLGEQYRRLRRRADARRVFKRALALEPGHSRAAHGLAALSRAKPTFLARMVKRLRKVVGR